MVVDHHFRKPPYNLFRISRMESPLNAALQGGLLDLATLASQKGVKERGAHGLQGTLNVERYIQIASEIHFI